MFPLNASFYAPPNLGVANFVASQFAAGAALTLRVYSQTTYIRTTASADAVLVLNETNPFDQLTSITLRNASLGRGAAEAVSIGSNARGLSGTVLDTPTVKAILLGFATYDPVQVTSSVDDSGQVKEIHRAAYITIGVTIGAVNGYVLDADETFPIEVLWDDVVAAVRAQESNSSTSLPLSGLCAPLSGARVPLIYLRVAADRSSLNAAQMAAQYSSAVFIGGLGILGALAGMSATASDLQMTGALGFMPCSDPYTHASLNNVRILSPFAIEESYVGVILGNVLFAVALFVGQIAALGFFKLIRGVTHLQELQAKVRFPALTYSAIVAFYTGSMFSAGKLVTPAPFDDVSDRIPNGAEGGGSMLDSFLFSTSQYSASSYTPAGGAIGLVVFVCLFAALFPVFLCLWASLRIPRAFQVYCCEDWLLRKGGPASCKLDALFKSHYMTATVMPVGAIFSKLTRDAYGFTISAIRARQHFWASYMTWGGSVAFVAGVVSPRTVGGCQAYFSIIAVVYFLFAAALAFLLPMRSLADNILEVASKAVVGVVFCSAAVAAPGDSAGTTNASHTITAGIVALVVVLIVRIVVFFVSWYYDFRMEKEQIPMEVEWSHELTSKGLAKLFVVGAADEELQKISSNRDTNGGADNQDGDDASITRSLIATDNSGDDVSGREDNNAPQAQHRKMSKSTKAPIRKPVRKVTDFYGEEDAEEDMEVPLQSEQRASPESVIVNQLRDGGSTGRYQRSTPLQRRGHHREEDEEDYLYLAPDPLKDRPMYAPHQHHGSRPYNGAVFGDGDDDDDLIDL